jgi:pimeloyl-ACP methyl ester carboxylesterase
MSASTLRWRAAAAAASASLLLVLAGCTAGAPPESVATATSTPTAAPTCWSRLGASTETVPRPSPIQVVLLGSGPGTVVFSNQSDADLCVWIPFAKTLVDKGLRVALYNYTGAVDQDLVAVVEHLRTEGTTSIAVLGGSEGAKASIVAAAKLDPQPAALVSLSPEAAIQRVPVAPSAAQVRCPALFVTGDDDGYGSTPATKNFYAVSPSTDKKLLVIPGKQHGVELLSRPDVSGAVIDFLTAHLG